jgi:hypothetical protein
MTTDDTRPSDCGHNRIVTYREAMGGPARMWACADCQRRFYPACPTCVDLGHRNETHPEPPDHEVNHEEKCVLTYDHAGPCMWTE